MPSRYYDPPPLREIPGLRELGCQYPGVSQEKLEEYQTLNSRLFTELATGTRDYSNFVSAHESPVIQLKPPFLADR